MRPMMSAMNRYDNEDGFVLATAILAMVVVASAVAAGYFIANQEYHVGKSMRESTSAFYAAQAGLEREYATWSIRDRWTMKAGQTLNVGPVTQPNGTAYRGTVTRVDNHPESDTDSERYYVIQMTGLAPAPMLGEEVRSRQGMILRVRYYDFCCTAAIQAKDTFTQGGSSIINGENTTPLSWAGQCDSTDTSNKAGVEVQCSTCYNSVGVNDTTLGDPPTEVDTTLQSESLTEWDEVTWGLLKSKATKIYAPGVTVTNTAPAYTTDPFTGLPICDESVQSNWGEPTNSLDVCFNYWPIIYAQGNLTIQSASYGQGILLVEGDLTLAGGYQFYGIILVKGHLNTQGTGAKVTGSVVVAGETSGSMTNSMLAGNSEVNYSACAVARAKRFAELAKKEPLPLRAWTEALN